MVHGLDDAGTEARGGGGLMNHQVEDGDLQPQRFVMVGLVTGRALMRVTRDQDGHLSGPRVNRDGEAIVEETATTVTEYQVMAIQDDVVAEYRLSKKYATLVRVTPQVRATAYSHALVMPKGWDQYRTANGQVPGFRRIPRVHLCDGRTNQNRNSAPLESVKAGTYAVTCPECLARISQMAVAA
jgi:hypothetical protein